MAEKKAKVSKKVVAEAAPVESKQAPKKAAAPKKSKDRKFLEDFLVEIKKSPLTRRDVINKVQQYLKG